MPLPSQDTGTDVDQAAADAVAEPKAPEAPEDKAVVDDQAEDADKDSDDEDSKDDEDSDNVAEPEPLQSGIVIS